MLAIEWRFRCRATRILCRRKRAKPQSEMVHLNRIEGRVHGGVRNHSVVENGWRRRATLRERERLHTEAAHELGMAAAGFVSGNVALIPRHAKVRLRNLKHEEIEIGIGR